MRHDVRRSEKQDTKNLLYSPCCFMTQPQQATDDRRLNLVDDEIANTQPIFEKTLAGEGGFEPPHTDPESAVLPLDDSPASH